MPPSRLHRQIYSPCQELVLISLPRFPPFDGMLLLCDPPIDLVDFFVQVRHPLIESFEPVEKPPLDMADGHQASLLGFSNCSCARFIASRSMRLRSSAPFSDAFINSVN